MRKQGIALRQITDGTLLRQQAAKRLAAGGQQAGDGAQQCGLALSALPQQDGEALDVEVDLQSHRTVGAVIDAHRSKTSSGAAKSARGSKAAASSRGKTCTGTDRRPTTRCPVD